MVLVTVQASIVKVFDLLLRDLGWRALGCRGLGLGFSWGAKNLLI